MKVFRSAAEIKALGDHPPTIETVEGVGGEYLIWTREMILDLLRRVAELERSQRGTVRWGDLG